MSTAETLPVPRRSVLMTMAAKYNMEPAAFEATLRATCIPGNATREQFAAFLVVANAYGLNPLTKEIYAFPSRGGIQPIVSLDGWCNLINSHPQCNGIEFDDHVDGSRIPAITCRIWRKDRDRPVSVTEYLAECVQNTPAWQKYPRRMLRHKALIQAARYAFGFAGIIDPDEADRHEPGYATIGEPIPRTMAAQFDHLAEVPKAESSPAPEPKRPRGRPRKVAQEVEPEPATDDQPDETVEWADPDAELDQSEPQDPDYQRGVADAKAGRRGCLDTAISTNEPRFRQWLEGFHAAGGKS